MTAHTATKPEGPTGDFQGDIQVNDTPPNAKMLANAASLPLLDENNKKHTFKSLYEGKGRIIVVFIRHFFCGNCQEYTRTLSEQLPPATLSALPTPTSLVLIGCGSVELIPMYKASTKTPFPIYADPTRKIYDVLGMTKTLSLGNKSPRYMRQPMYKLSLKSVLLGLQSGRHALSGGDFWQVGGEFVFQPNGTVDWCHRMKNTRDHAEMEELRKAIHMDDAEETTASSVPPGKPIGSRRSMSGAGLVCRLSDRRKSWRNSISRRQSRNIDANGTVAPSIMAELKEEPGAPDGDRDAALAKLTGGANDSHEPSTSNGAVPNGQANGTVPHGLENGSVNPVMKPVPATVEPVVENIANGSAERPIANGSLHKNTPFVQNFLNGTVEKNADEVDSSRADVFSNNVENEVGKVSAENGAATANGHILQT